MDLYPDSLRFFDLAKNIINNDWFVVRGVHINYQKVLYSICISPFFLIKNVILRMKSIEFFNILISLGSIFPTYLIIDNIVKKDENKKICILLFAVSPIFLYSKTVLSESLYIFLFMFSTYFLVKSIQTKKIKYYIWCAVFLFLSYMCREIAIVYFGAIIFTFILMKLNIFGLNISKDLVKNKKIDIKNELVFTIIFLVLFIFTNYFLLRNVGYTYGVAGTNQIGFDILKNPKVLLDFIFSNIYMVCGICIIFMIIPLVIVFNNIKNMDDTNKFVFLANVFNILFLIIVIAFTITIREDVDLEYKRLHFRYMICSIPLLMFEIINSIEDRNLCEKKNYIFSFIIFVIFVVFFRGMHSFYFDNTFLYTYKFFDDFIKIITFDSFIDFIRSIIIDIFIFLIIFVIYKKSCKNDNKFIKKMIILVFFANFLISTIYGNIIINKNLNCNKIILDDVLKINEYNFGKNDVILFLSKDRTRSKASVTFDSYNNLQNKIISNDIESYFKYKNEEIDVKEHIFIDTIIKGEHKDIHKIDYVLVEKCNEFDMLNMANLEKIIEYNNYVIYKNVDKEKIVFK